MEKILAYLKIEIDYNQEIKKWYRENYDPDFRETNQVLLDEKTFQNKLNQYDSDFLLTTVNVDNQVLDEKFLEIARKELRSYFKDKIDTNQVEFPRVKIVESYKGSWNIETIIYAVGAAGTVLTYLKKVSDIPKMVDGLKELEERIKKKYTKWAKQYLSKVLKKKTGGELPEGVKEVSKVTVNLDDSPISESTPAKKDSKQYKKLAKDLKSYLTVGLISLASFGILLGYHVFSNHEGGSVDLTKIKKDISILKNENLKLQEQIKDLQTISQQQLDVIKSTNDLIEKLEEQNQSLRNALNKINR